MILAEKIALLRKRNEWSQEQLAEKLDISRQSVSKWESGASIPDMDKILKLSRLFEVSTDYLLKDEIVEENEKIPKAEEEYQPPERAVYLWRKQIFTWIWRGSFQALWRRDVRFFSCVRCLFWCWEVWLNMEICLSARIWQEVWG